MRDMIAPYSGMPTVYSPGSVSNVLGLLGLGLRTEDPNGREQMLEGGVLRRHLSTMPGLFRWEQVWIFGVRWLLSCAAVDIEVTEK